MWHLPQPFEIVDHTADTGVRVRGASREEALARLLLGHAQLLAGGPAPQASEETTIEVPGGDLALVAVDCLRATHRLFCSRQLIATEVEVLELSEKRAQIRLMLGPYHPQVHAEGADIKAITYHMATFEQDEQGWVAQVVFDV
jgi:SHS2 domain-containing protein